MKGTIASQTVPSSFRDPSGFLFFHDGSIYRQVNTVYKANYDHFIESGLYKSLVDANLLIPHEEVEGRNLRHNEAYKVIKPEPLPFISYPYEWCFSQLKHAALTTVKVQKIALEFGMSLKDSSAYNIQFRKGKPIFIDTLSFEKYKEGKPWIAYRQFCQHFLAPLALARYKDIRLKELFRIFIDGIPLDLASKILPLRTYLKFSLLSHIHLHAKSQRHFADKTIKTNGRKVSRLAFLGLIDNLESAVKNLNWQPQDTEWTGYYKEGNYSSDALSHKKQLVAQYLSRIKPKIVWDLGANTGLFSRISSDKGAQTISFDIDTSTVEKNYLEATRKGEINILPLVLDLSNPSPALGWQSEERMSLLERGPADTVLALALIHHLAISNNLPFSKIAKFFSQICISLIIEYIPKDDSQVQRLLLTRNDIFPDYNQQVFDNEFNKYFEIRDSARIKDSQRTLYLMQKR